MRKQGEKNHCKAWLSAWDTEKWATRTGNSWPCSTLRGCRLFVDIMNGDLVDITIDGKYGDCDGHELDAMLDDLGIRG